MNDQRRSTDPGWYTTADAVRTADTDTLLAVRDNAQRTFNTCGGHRLADEMRHVMDMIDAELARRDVPECYVEFGPHDHIDGGECEQIVARMSDPSPGWDPYDDYPVDAQQDHYERWGRPAFPNEY